MISIGQLDFMDNPTSQVDHRLLDPSTFVRPATNVPLRHRNDDFKRFNSSLGSVVNRGANDYQFENPRVYGKTQIN